MKRIFGLAINFIKVLFLPREHLVITEKELSNCSIKIMIWSRIILKFLIWLIALLLITRFAMLMGSVFFN